MKKILFFIVGMSITILSIQSEDVTTATTREESNELIEREMTEEEWDAELDEINKRVNQIGEEMRQDSIKQARQLLVDAQQNISEKKYDEAQKQFLKIIDTDDAEPEVRGQAAIHLAEDICIGVHQDKKSAFTIYDAVAQMHTAPQAQLLALKRAADLSYVQHDFEYTIKLYKKLAAQRKDKQLSVYARFQLGQEYLFSSTNYNPRLATYYFQQVAEQDIDPEIRVRAWFELAKLFAYLGPGMDFDKEIDYLTKVSEQDVIPDLQGEAFLKMGDAYLNFCSSPQKRRNVKKAIECFYKAIEWEKLHPAWHLMREARETLIHIYLGRYEFLNNEEFDYEKGMEQCQILLREDTEKLRTAKILTIIAEIHRNGLYNQKVDAKKAAECYKEASECKIIDMDLTAYLIERLIEIGDAYRDGTDKFEKNLILATEYYKRAAAIPHNIFCKQKVNNRMQWVIEQEQNEKKVS